ncbi:membrane protease YdiL (CAAX protease family) [Mesonia maritima]|uniref:Membrane protease YdiL (CAAX protease family) n=3 Tax=Mesonia maritima TaxID=1793873 RepID=A0ABU1K3P9_9FLAO|nr:membrane protease YdiL (CAAX protease family) [Mesonia maritima]
MITPLFYIKYYQIQLTINKIISQNYFIMIYLTSICFGAIHMTNYEEVNVQTFLSVIGRVMGGFYFAFIVTKYSLKSSYLLHAINNIIPFFILLGVK